MWCRHRDPPDDVVPLDPWTHPTHLPCHHPLAVRYAARGATPAGLRSLVERDYRTIPVVVEGGQGASAMCSSQIMSDWLRDE